MPGKKGKKTQQSPFNAALIHEVGPCLYEVPVGFIPNMRVPGYFVATPELARVAIEELSAWSPASHEGSLPSLIQIANMATFPGIVRGSFGMADMHTGYGFTIGGVAAFDAADPAAVVFPGGIGYDINCGIRLLATDLTVDDVAPAKRRLLAALCEQIPAGVGGKRRQFTNASDIYDICAQGARWAVDHGFGVPRDLEMCEEGGCVEHADVSAVSDRCIERALGHLGTLGSGNHFIELQAVDRVFHAAAAAAMGLRPRQAVVMIHTGSRGLGYQLASDFMVEVERKCEIRGLPDRQLSCVPLNSALGRRYVHAMGCAANFAFCNRQVITHFVRAVFRDVLQRPELEMPLVYDLSHNIGKFETHMIDGSPRELFVHRKGATRAFGPGHPAIPERYRGVGQPVLVGGSLGTASYVLVGTAEAMERSIGSSCHGAGRTLSRTKASREVNLSAVKQDLAARGIEVKAAGRDTLLEEAPETYKDIERVVSACASAGISKRVARLVPLAVVKG
jgi:tRNA-splicing ligase RtcB